jgi:ABC-2 type transport system ATP-binding protein
MNSLAELKGARKRFGKNTALDGVDLAVQPGEVVALLGPNGAGKSTAIGLMLGLIQPDEGEVRLMGLSPAHLDARRGVGVMMQEVQLSAELKVGELVQLTASYYPAPMKARDAVEAAGVGKLKDRRYGKLSGGQKRLAQFALAICGRPRLIFLDEPTANLDVEAREHLWATVRRLVDEGCSVVLTTHHVEEAEALASRIVVLAAGRVIAQGGVDEVRAVVGRRRVACATRLAEGDVRRWPEVETARSADGLLEMSSPHAEALVRRLLEADPGLERLEVRRASLSEAVERLLEERT